MSVIPELERLRQEDHKIQASLAYTVRPYLKKIFERPGTVIQTCNSSYWGGQDW
jgi:hypothetical protein